ncbi:hypothetical protein RND71_002976 [Anisodus tanguticus]|uniref:Uncharacterized protein n=1 Tax=Anisodus tanguticus TaxID=243964 RepID=A0AAE1SV49_9SOLA|nr:hypothetical protein RND71_002976 [Anisodus tanguticus]
MVFISNKPFVLLICIGLLVVLPEKVSSLTRSDFSLKWSTQQQNEQMMLKTRRMLNGLVKNELNNGIKSAPVSENFDPNGSSKRRVRKGSNPIHNRS